MSMPKGKHIFGTVKVGERGQIVIPKEAREIFDINPGDTLLVLGDEEQGIAVVKADVMKEVAVKILKGLGRFGREKEMMKNSFFSILPFFLAADLMLPFLLAPTYKGYSHLRQVMSVLGASKAPLHSIYNFWLIIFGCAILISIFQCYPIIAKTSNIISIILCSIIFIYAIGGCILSGIFSVGETKKP